MKKYITRDLVTLFVKTWNKTENNWRQVESRRINFGWCYQFAILMRRLHGDKVKLYHDLGHAWVRIGDKYYDSDHMDGVNSYTELYCVKGNDVSADVSEEELAEFWQYGGSGPVRYDIIDKVVAKYRSREIGA